MCNTVWRDGLAGAAELSGGVGERQAAAGDLGHEAGADLVGEPDPPRRAGGGLLGGQQPVVDPARIVCVDTPSSVSASRVVSARNCHKTPVKSCAPAHGIAWSDYFVVEIVDPESGGCLPPGEEGEVVATTLRKEGMPLIRYRTRDLTRLYTEPCPCGSPFPSRFAAPSARPSEFSTIEHERDPTDRAVAELGVFANAVLARGT